MEIEEMKIKVAGVCQLLEGGLSCDEDGVRGDDWDSLADELAAMARHAAVGANRLAAYAGIARRKANLS